MPAKQAAEPVMPDAPNAFFTANAGDSLLFFAHLQANAVKAMLKWQVESLNFLKHRYEQDMKFIDELLEAPEPGEMLSAYSCFLQNALDEYSRESVKAANYSSKVVTDAAKEIRRKAESVSENMMAATVA